MERLCEKAELLEFPEGSVLLHPDAGFDATYLIRSGFVKACRRSLPSREDTRAAPRAPASGSPPLPSQEGPGGGPAPASREAGEQPTELTLALLGRGDSFGPLAPLENGGPGATYKAMTLLSVARITWQDIDAVLGRSLPQAPEQARPQTCENCVAAPCLTDCPIGAIQRTPDGAVTLDESCFGCGACVENCPTGQLSLEQPPPGAGPESPPKAVLKPPPQA
jgi:NAD-dependent dihydropyrimidine dehydrogenase PreA subunit